MENTEAKFNPLLSLRMSISSANIVAGKLGRRPGGASPGQSKEFKQAKLT
jgi:hypothetical protein